MSAKGLEQATAKSTLKRKGDREAAEHEHRIYEHLLRAIVERRLPPGAKLPEHELAAIFGINRSRMRRVLGRLGQDRMVTQILNRGSFVAKPSMEDAREVFSARRLLEETIVRQLVVRGTKSSIQRLRAHVAKERAAATRRDAIAMVRLSGEFHIIVAETLGNTILAGFLRELIARSSLVVALYELAAPADCSHEEHTAILDAMEAGDSAKAAACMLHHLTDIESRLRLLDEDEPKIDLKAILSVP